MMIRLIYYNSYPADLKKQLQNSSVADTTFEFISILYNPGVMPPHVLINGHDSSCDISFLHNDQCYALYNAVLAGIREGKHLIELDVRNNQLA